MRILFVHSIGKKKFGGGERWVVNAASGLKSKGHEVFAACRKNSVLSNELHKEGIHLIGFNLYSNISLYQVFRLSRIIRKNRIDVVICKGHELTVSGIAARWRNNALLIRRSGSPPPSKSLKLYYRTKWFTDGVVTNTHTIKEIFQHHGFTEKDFVKVIYNGLKVDDEVQPFDFSANYPGKTIVLSIGRAVGHKGYYHLIDALPAIAEIYPDLFFFVIGDGKEKEQLIRYALKKGVENKIKFAGYIHHPVPYIKGCDLFLHPSLYEGMPNAAMEAMAYGKPVIMTRVNGADELSENGKYAYLIPPADPDSIVGAVKKAMENKASFEKMGEDAGLFVRENFSMQKMVDYLEAYILERMKLKQNNSLKQSSNGNIRMDH
ncbi:MAG: glycosyltransferase [Bacteroidales bacterium]|nr:glycosyltransferase [Bacteroidales bacterium]